MRPTYLQLAYEGNYVGRGPLETLTTYWEHFTYKGKLFTALYSDGTVVEII